MNSEFTNEQIEAYARNFREGDAVWIDGEWWEVGEYYGAVMLYSEIGVYVINHGETVGYNPVIEGFRKNYKYCNDNPYRVTTLEHYKLKGGEKIIRLDDTSARVSSGKSYTVSNFRDEDDYYWIICDNGERFYIGEIKFLNRWGIIPRYEQVKEKGSEEMGEIKVVEATKYTGKFKVGDEVRVVAVTEREKEMGWVKVGEIGIVTYLDEEDEYHYAVVLGDRAIWFNEATLELVEEGENVRPASSHYHQDNNGNDVWQFADDNLSRERVEGFHQVNAIKYVSRYNKKHDTIEKQIEDLEKAKVSIDKIIELLSK